VELDYKGQEQIPVSKAKVWSFINDPAKVASCLPDLIDSNVVDEHNVDATVKVAVGPVSGKFKFKIQLLPNPDGNHMDMKINGGGFGSVVDLTAGADLKDNGTGTTLDWSGHANMRGPVATVGGRVLDAQAQRVISTTFSNVKAKLSA
jgi:uncharacterized protein